MNESDGLENLKKLGLLLHLAWMTALGAAVATGFALLLQPLHASVSDLSDQQEMLQSTIEQSEEVRQKNESLKRRLSDVESKLTDLRKRIPDLPREADFLGQVTELAKSTGVEIDDYRPGTVRERARYHEMDIQLTAVGEYRSICSLLQKLGEMPRLCRVTRMTMTAPVKDQNCSLALTVVIFFAPPKADAGENNRG